MSAVDRCTDEAGMAALLQAALPGFGNDGARIDALRVHKARRSGSIARNPNPIALTYELTVRDGARRGALRLYGKMFRDGESAPCFASIDRTRLAQPAWGEPLVHLPALDMVLWALPNDPGLPQLPALLDAARLRAHLPWAELGVRADRLHTLHTELLRHEPEQRATVRCTLTLDGTDAPCVLYGKTFCDGRGRDVDERFRHFWQLAQRDPTAPRVAQPLGHDARTGTAWQAGAPGAPLRDALTRRDAPALLARVAAALARVQAAPLSPRCERSMTHWLAELRRRRTKIGRADPALATRVHRLVQRLEAQAVPLKSRPLSLIHGDFHPDQVWLHEDRVVLFDFDEFAMGDVMEDVAAFATKLDAADQRRAFIAAWAAEAGVALDHSALQWHLALQAVLQASRAFVFQRPGWRTDLEGWLARAEALAAGDIE